MFGQLSRRLGGNSFLPRMGGADRLKQFRVDLTPVPLGSFLALTTSLQTGRRIVGLSPVVICSIWTGGVSVLVTM